MAIGLIRDLRLSVQAERALKADRVLAPLNLRVKVRNGVAELSGSIPSDEVGRQAVAKVESVKGIEDVRPTFQYTKGAKPEVAEARPPDKRTVIQAAKPVAVPPAASEPPRPRPGGTAPLVSTGEGRKGRPNDEVSNGVRMGQPRKVASRPARTEAESEAAPLTLAQRVERVRRSDKRFQAIPVEIDGDLLVVKRGAAPSEDATALSQALRRLPGISGVLIEKD
jgi:hypothetical protein